MRARELLRLRSLIHNEVIAFLKSCRAETQEVATRAARLRHLLDGTDDEPAHPDGSLMAALEQMAAPPGLRVRVTGAASGHAGPDAAPEVVEAVVDAVGELARNARLHGGATSLTVGVHPDGLVVVDDDGAGTPRDFRPGSGLGLAAMQLAAVGARLELPPSGRAARFELHLPTARAGRAPRTVPMSLRAPLLPAVAVTVGMQLVLAVRYSVGDRFVAAELVLAVALAVATIVLARRLASHGRAPGWAVPAIGLGVCGATWLGLALAGPEATRGYDSWVIAFAGGLIAVLAAYQPIGVVATLVAAQFLTVVGVGLLNETSDWDRSVGALTAPVLLPAMLYLLSGRVRSAEETAREYGVALGRIRRDVAARVTRQLTETSPDGLIGAEVLPLLRAIEDGELRDEPLAVASRAVETIARVEYAHPGAADQWTRARLAAAADREITVTCYEPTEWEPGRGQVAVRLLGATLEVAPDASRVTLSVSGPEVSVDVVPGCGPDGLRRLADQVPRSWDLRVEGDDVMSELRLGKVPPLADRYGGP